MKKIYLLILLLTLFCAGCFREDSPIPPNMVGEDLEEAEESKADNDSYANADITMQSEWKGLDYNEEYAEAYGAKMEDAENGMYFLSNVDHSILYYWDKESGSAVPLCDKIDCEHDSYECNALFDFIDSMSLEYENGYLYFYGRTGDNPGVIYQTDSTGNNRISLGSPIAEDNRGIAPESMEVHGEYCYLAGRGGYKEDGTVIYRVGRMKLEGQDNLDIIYEYEGDEWEQSILYLGKLVDDSLFFLETRCKKDGEDLISQVVLYEYNVQNGELKVILKEDDATAMIYALNEESIYYSTFITAFPEDAFITNTHQPVMKMDRDTGEKTEFISEGGRVTYDGQFFYVWVDFKTEEDFKLRIYNKNGELVQIMCPQAVAGYICAYTTQNYILFSNDVSPDVDFEIVSKAEIGKKEYRYQFVNVESAVY